MRKSLFLMMLIILSLYLCSFTDNKTNISTKSSDRYYDGNEKVDVILENEYSDYDVFTKKSDVEVKQITGQNPININVAASDRFKKTEILEALSNSSSESTYGGCGPIAMIGIFDYLSTVLGYNEIISNPNDSSVRINFATKIFNEVPTYEVGTSGDKGTLILPWSYESHFNELIKEFGLYETIEAHNYLDIITSNELEKLKESINNGLPVTIYAGFINSEPFSEHYFVCYGYVDYVLYHKETKERLDKTFLLCHTNVSDGKGLYCDADILNELQCGIICYDIKYNETNIAASDFSEEFINHSTNQGQYFYDEIEEDVTTSSGYSFNTKRLRCSYIEQQYLVLSANRSGAGEAYLEFILDDDIRAIEFDMGLWSGLEGFSLNDIISVEYYDNSYIRHMIYDYQKLNNNKDNLAHYKIIFPKEINRFRIYVKCNTIVQIDRNKGRVVLDNIKLKEEYKHIHTYKYTSIDSKSHRGVCNGCGDIVVSRHAILASQSGSRYVNCYVCGYLLDLSKDIAFIIYD